MPIRGRDMAILEENDVLFAHKALTLMAGLSDATKRVAGAIIDHFNKRTGQCDPSIERLATLLGTDEKTVRRATAILDDKQIIAKTSHGGKAHRASYVPNWELFRAVVADWDARMKTGRAPSKEAVTVVSKPEETNRAKLSGSTGQDCPVKPGEIALQTLRRNPSKKPIEPEPVETRRQEAPSQRPQQPLQVLGRGSKPQGQGSFLLPISGGKGASRADAAKAAAERRWYAQLHGLGERAEADVLDWMTPDRQEAATLAEVTRRGGGMAFIMQGMQRGGLAAHG